MFYVHYHFFGVDLQILNIEQVKIQASDIIIVYAIKNSDTA